MNLFPDVLAAHDVSGGTHLRTLPLILDPGDAIIAAAVTVVAPSPDPFVAPEQAIEIWGDKACSTHVLTYGSISSGTQGDTWGVNLYLRYGAANIKYTLQLRYRLSSQPEVDQYDELYRVPTVA